MMKKWNKLLCAVIALAFVFAAAAEQLPIVEDVPLRQAHIRVVGDLMMHQRQLELGQMENGEYDFAPQYALVKTALSDADYTIANLETTVGLYGNQPYSGYPRFNAPESLLAAIKDAGVDFLTLANNHILDRYFDGMVTTVNNVENYGFDFTGAYRTPEEAGQPVVIEVNGIKLGMLAYTAHTNGMEAFSDAEATEYGVSYLYGADFEADVQKLRDAGADVIIAMPHWGTEYKRQPDADVRRTAEKLAAAGVDVILGSHPHMVQPIEWLTVETETGEHTALVAWSLGNFIDNMKIQYTDSGIILDFTIVEAADGGFDIVDVGYVPIYCWRQDANIQALCSGEYLDERPEGMSDATYDRMKLSHRELVELIGDDFILLEN